MSPFSFQPFSDAHLILGVNVLVQITLAAGLALMIGRCVGRNPTIQYWILFSAFLLILFSPLTSACFQRAGFSLWLWQIPEPEPSPIPPAVSLRSTVYRL